MVDAAPRMTSRYEQRVIFGNRSWQAYEQILSALGDHRLARLTYDKGTLEITMPSEEHEYLRAMLELFIRILVEELDLKMKTMGSTTLNYPNLQRGAEPDNAYYIHNQPQVAGKTVDLALDPPPDLVIEIDIAHTDIDKLSLYADMGVPEFWRHNGQILRIYQLQDQQYAECETSLIFPNIPKSRLYEFLEAACLDEVQASRALRLWVRQQIS
jgi:Uma2 family endonuclease